MTEKRNKIMREREKEREARVLVRVCPHNNYDALTIIMTPPKFPGNLQSVE